MAGTMDEYDPATPVSKVYCSRLTAEEYEEQASSCTEDALADLIEHLQKNPLLYSRVVGHKKKEEEENAGFFSYAKVKLLSLFTGKDIPDVSEEDCSREVDRVTSDMAKVFAYSEESKGRRCSKRLAAKRARDQGNSTPCVTPQVCKSRKKMVISSLRPTPPPPPPPPPPPTIPSSTATPLVETTLSRRPLSARQPNQRVKSLRPRHCNRKSEMPGGGGDTDAGSGSSSNLLHDLLHELNDSGKKRMLRSTVPRSPGGTPVAGWPKSKQQCDTNLGYFNSKLVDKFRNIRSPVLSSLAAPGTFGSPVSESPPSDQS